MICKVNIGGIEENMTIIDKLKKKVEQYNLLARRRRLKMQSRLTNQDITFLTPNCIGGILFHDLGLKFMSPTVNLMMTQTDFVKFVLNMDDYLKKNLYFSNIRNTSVLVLNWAI